MSGTLVLCATPIGNLGDAPPRLAEAIRDADVVFAEDTRRSRKLAGLLGVDRPMQSFFAGNEAERLPELKRHLEQGATVALLTDAGTPGLADPGYAAVRAAVDVGARVTIVPGPSAVTAALAVSGLPSERFVFEGFLPRKGEPRRRRLDDIVARHETSVIFASPQRAGHDLADLAERDPQRHVVVARELTKLHEEVWRGPVADAAAAFADTRGELVLVMEGAPVAAPDVGSAVELVAAAVEGGASFADAVRDVADTAGVSRRALYEAALKAR
jgi:16S rRNA (cytidine1402-2'-O)-methyltransferase